MLEPRLQVILTAIRRTAAQCQRHTLHHSQNHARIPRPLHPQSRRQHTSSNITHEVAKFSWVPRVLRRSTWDLVIPKVLRRNPLFSAGTRKPRNPATYFLWIYLLIGSQAIRIINVQSSFTAFTRQTDLKLEKLREVLQKLQRGEEVDVEGILGTGDETQEKEWEEAMREIEEEEDRWVKSRRKLREKRAKEDELRVEREREEEESRLDASPVARGQEAGRKIVSAVGFY